MAEESKIVDVLSSIEDAIKSASVALEDMNDKALRGGLGFDVLIKSAESGTKAFAELTDSVGAFGSALTFGLDFGLFSKGMSTIGDLFETVIGGATHLIAIFDGVGKGMDAITGFSRNLNATLFESVLRFNGNFEAAKQFSEYIINSSQKFATAEFGFISPADRIAAVKGLEQAGIPLAKMADQVDSAAGSMDLLNTAFLHSQALGLELTSYLEMIGDAMLRQGLNSQQAVEQLALFGDISETTGIRTDKVSRSLQGLSNRFSKLGVTANFGKPLLEGFASSLTSMGLGFENAIELSEDLSNSLVKLTSDYSAAFITFQRGGLDFGGGGGALGAGISLRAELLKANETGDQGELAMQLAGAVKETLASFTGGSIVSVQEAAENPALQQTFFTQTQLLKDLYGITEAAEQDRTLELLQKLETATQTGDEDLKMSLGEDLKNIIQGNNSTLSYAEKTAKATESTFAELQSLNKNIINATQVSSDSLTSTIIDFQKDLLKNPETSELIQALNARPDDFKIDFKTSFESLKDSTGNLLSKFGDKLGGLDQLGSDMVNALKNTTLNVSNPTGDLALSDLKGSIDALVQRLGEYLNKRETSNLIGP